MDEKIWTENEMKELLDKVLGDKIASRKKFNPVKTTSDLPWNELKIDGKSVEDCEKAFKKMTSYICKQMTVQDIVSATRSRLDEKKIPLEMVPNAPKKPSTAYFLFSNEKYASILKKNPGISFLNVSTITKDKWTSLSEEKKEKYFSKYRELKASYDAFQAEFVKVTQKKKAPRKKSLINPFEMYFESEPIEVSKHDAKQHFMSLSEKETLKWILVAVNEFRTLKGNSSESDGSQPLKLHLKESEKRILLKSEGIFEKPSRTLYAFYRHKYKDDFKGLESLNEAYRNLEPKEIKQLNEDYLKELNLYCSRVNNYLERMECSMTVEEVEEAKYQNKTFEKIIKKTKEKESSLNKKSEQQASSKSKSKKSAVKSFVETHTKEIGSPVKIEALIKDTPVSSRKRKVSEGESPSLNSSQSSKKKKVDSVPKSEETPKKKKSKSNSSSTPNLSLNSSQSKSSKKKKTVQSDSDTELEDTPKQKKRSRSSTSLNEVEVDSDISFKIAPSKEKTKQKKSKRQSSSNIEDRDE